MGEEERRRARGSGTVARGQAGHGWSGRGRGAAEAERPRAPPDIPAVGVAASEGQRHRGARIDGGSAKTVPERRQRSAGKAAAEEIGLLMDLRVVGSGATRRKGFPWAVGSFVEAAVNSKS